MNMFKKVMVAMFGLMLAAQVHAVSLIDFTGTAFTGAATDITDTGAEAATFVVPIILGVVALLVGIKLLKRFANRI